MSAHYEPLSIRWDDSMGCYRVTEPDFATDGPEQVYRERDMRAAEEATERMTETAANAAIAAAERGEALRAHRDALQGIASARSMATCSHYTSGGACSGGCHDEPRCMTCEPSGGWDAAIDEALAILDEEEFLLEGEERTHVLVPVGALVHIGDYLVAYSAGQTATVPREDSYGYASAAHAAARGQHATWPS